MEPSSNVLRARDCRQMTICQESTHTTRTQGDQERLKSFLGGIREEEREGTREGTDEAPVPGADERVTSSGPEKGSRKGGDYISRIIGRTTREHTLNKNASCLFSTLCAP